MPEVSFEEGKKFLNEISKDDSVVVIHHDDLDGFSSGLLFVEHCKKMGAKTANVPFTIGNNQDIVVKQTNKANKIIICDLAPQTIEEVLEGITKKEVFYTDHHQKPNPIPEKILEFRTIKDGYIPSSRTAYELVGGKQWLAIAGTIGDAGQKYPENKKFLDSFFKKTRIPFAKFQEEIVFTISSFLVYFYDKPQKAFKLLAKIDEYTDVRSLKKYARTVEKEIQKFSKRYKKDHEVLGLIDYFYFDPKYPVKSIVGSNIGVQYPQSMLVLAVPRGERVQISGRTQRDDVNMIEILQAGIKGLEDATAGGHIKACGGSLQKKDLKMFKEQISKYRHN